MTKQNVLGFTPFNVSAKVEIDVRVHLISTNYAIRTTKVLKQA